ncbi:hypothetical protein [Sulfurovum sp.]|uniref:hypothetical protein n=1 Tax=Sulfurovum sp. TaxID=1969726 RepID=UPI003567C52B
MKNPVAKHFNKSCRPSIVPSKRLYNRRQDLPSRVALDDLENASEGSDTQGKEAIELMFDSECWDGVKCLTETNELEE